jgi:phosphatidylglycerophosphatase A
MKAYEAIATLGGLGRVRVAPGTVASLAALVPAFLIAWLGGRFALLAAGLLANAVGAWACEHYARETGRDDPSECVVDELAGQWIACAFVPLSPHSIAPLSLEGFALAFLLFRAFDITKPWPISRLEHLPGGFGIMADDLAAGLLAGAIIAMLAHAGIV